MRFTRTLTLVGLAAIALASNAFALDVFNYNATSNERFSSGFPNSPTVNSSFFLNGYNLSGIGWTSGNFGVTMISPQHFVTAAHVSIGSTVTFMNTDGVLKSYTVSGTATIQHTEGVATDLQVGRLIAAIPTGDNVTHYSTLLLNSASDYIGLTVAAFGTGQRAGINTIDVTGSIDMLPFGSPNGTDDNIVFVTDFDSVTGQTQGRAGDSGSPSFVSVNGSLAILGTHSAISTDTTPHATFDVLLPAYYSQINSILGLDGYSFGAFTPIPEPTSAIIAGTTALGLAVAVRRRRRRNHPDPSA